MCLIFICNCCCLSFLHSTTVVTFLSYISPLLLLFLSYIPPLFLYFFALYFLHSTIVVILFTLYFIHSTIVITFYIAPIYSYLYIHLSYTVRLRDTISSLTPPPLSPLRLLHVSNMLQGYLALFIQVCGILACAAALTFVALALVDDVEQIYTSE